MSVDLPRSGFVQPVEVVGGSGGGVDVIINGVTQSPATETVAALGAGATFTGTARDCLLYESFGISVFLDPLAGQAIDVTVLVENSTDGVTFRQVDSVRLQGAADANQYLNRVYSVTRRYYRISLVNNDGAHALDATEVLSMRKPI